MVILRPGDIHLYCQTDSNCIYRDVIIPIPLFKSVCDQLHPCLYNQITEHYHCHYLRVSDAQISYFESVLNYINKNATGLPNNGASLKPVILGVLSALLSSVFSQKEKKEEFTSLWFLEILKRFTVSEYIKGGIPKLLENINYNQAYICRVFKKNMGHTITEHLNSVRLSAAEVLLRTTDFPVSRIVEEVGFSSWGYFNALFKKTNGITPHQYRLSRTHVK